MPDTDEITVGSLVRYPRTGTTGKVIEIEDIPFEGADTVGGRYATLDSTGLRYRIDTLIPVSAIEDKRVITDSLDRLRRVEDLKTDEIAEAFRNVNGGGAG